MKIFFPIGAYYPSQIGGPCNTLYWHTRELRKNNIDVDIVTTTIGIENGLVKKNTFYLTEGGNVYYGDRGFKIFKTILQALKKVSNNDIIHLNSLFTHLSIIVFFYTKLFYNKKPIVFSVRGELNVSAMVFSNWKKRCVLFLYKKLCKNTTFHSTSNQETKDIYTYFKTEKIIQIPNFIMPSQRISKVETRKNLLYVGRIHPIKSIHKIIEGISMSKNFLNSEFRFLIVGKFEDRHKNYYDDLCNMILIKGLKDKIEFVGHLTGFDKELIYAQSYATLLLSETENFGNVVVESLNQGTPVIASMGTPWELVEQFSCGFHIHNDPPSIAEAVDKIIALKKEEYLILRKNAVKLVEKEFFIEKQIYLWVTFYKNLI